MLLALVIGSLLCFPQDTPTTAEGFRLLAAEASLDGWWGCGWEEHQALDAGNDPALHDRHADQLAEDWSCSDGVLSSDGSRLRLTTVEEFSNFEMKMSFRLEEAAYGGISLRGRALIELWDSSIHPHPVHAFGALNDGPGLYGGYKGSGGLSSNAPWTDGCTPNAVADRAPGEWNELRMVMVGERLSLWLNDVLVQDHAQVENEKGRDRALPRSGPLQLVCYRGPIQWRNLAVREIGHGEGLQLLGRYGASGFESVPTSALADRGGSTDCWELAEETLQSTAAGGWMYTPEEYADFTIRLEYKMRVGSQGSLRLRSGGPDEGSSGAIDVPLLGAVFAPEGTASEESASKETAIEQSGPTLRETINRHAAGFVAEGQWNSLEVNLRAERFRMELNGFRVLEGQLPLLGLTDCRASGLIALRAEGAGLSVRRLAIEAHDPSWPSLEPFVAASFWEAVPAFSGVEVGGRHTAETLGQAAKMLTTFTSIHEETKRVVAGLDGASPPAEGADGERHGHPVVPIVMHALAPLWGDSSWDESDYALADAAAALLAEWSDAPSIEFTRKDVLQNHGALAAVGEWFRAQASTDLAYAAMIYTLDDGPGIPVPVPVQSAVRDAVEVEERLPIGLHDELCLLARRPKGHQVLEVRRGGTPLHRVVLTEIPGQHRLTFERVSDALDLGACRA